LTVAEKTGNAGALVLANAGLARLAAAESPGDALAFADRALEAATTLPLLFEATLAKGWVLHDIGDSGSAACAAQAETLARRTASPTFLARAIELTGMTVVEP